MPVPQRVAVLIGNARFPSDPTHLSALRCPLNDVNGLAKLLASKKRGKYVVTKVLDARHDAARRAIYDSLKKARSGDLVLIYYSGHGKLDQEGRLHLATFDTVTDSLPPTSIPLEDVRKYIDESSASTKVVILDCCFSGAVKKLFKGEIQDQASRAIQGLEGVGTFFLTASTDTQLAEEKEGDTFSLLTKYIIEAIRGDTADTHRDGIVSFDELCSFVQEKVGTEGKQKPRKFCLDASGDIPIAFTGRPLASKRYGELMKALYRVASEHKAHHALRDLMDNLKPSTDPSEDVQSSAKELFEHLYKHKRDSKILLSEMYRIACEAKSPDLREQRHSFSTFASDHLQLEEEEPSNPSTHYNLAIAFREMGLVDEAIAELQKVSRDIDNGRQFEDLMQVYSLLAICFVKKGAPEAAIPWYKRALNVAGLQPESRLALQYELASCYEQLKDKSAAVQLFTQVYSEDINYRDVEERLRTLRKGDG